VKRLPDAITEEVLTVAELFAKSGLES